MKFFCGVVSDWLLTEEMLEEAEEAEWWLELKGEEFFEGLEVSGAMVGGLDNTERFKASESVVEKVVKDDAGGEGNGAEDEKRDEVEGFDGGQADDLALWVAGGHDGSRHGSQGEDTSDGPHQEDDLEHVDFFLFVVLVEHGD